MASRSRRMFRASFASDFPPSARQRAQGMPDARRVRSRAWCVVNTRVSHHGHAGNVRHSPRSGFNGLLRALPSDRAFLPLSPLRSLLLKNLTPASGRQDHATSPSATRLRQRIRRADCQSAEALAKADKAPSSKAPLASTASRPNVRDDGQRPSSGTGWLTI